MRGGNGKDTRKQKVGEYRQMVGDFSVIVDPHLWKLLKNADEDLF